jgi:hypothetical protein
MHFKGPTTRLLQLVNHHVLTATWKELCTWIHEWFGRDQHESLIRQLFHIKQTSSVQDYIDMFSELVYQLFAYGHSPDYRYYTAHFVDGLKDDVKLVVLIQWPLDLDFACTLALLQEEVDASRRRDFKKPDYLFKSKHPSQLVPVPVPLPPLPKLDKSLGAGGAKRRGNENFMVTPVDNKVVALRAYRKARGLCQFCT